MSVRKLHLETIKYPGLHANQPMDLQYWSDVTVCLVVGCRTSFCLTCVEDGFAIAHEHQESTVRCKLLQTAAVASLGLIFENTRKLYLATSRHIISCLHCHRAGSLLHVTSPPWMPNNLPRRALVLRRNILLCLQVRGILHILFGGQHLFIRTTLPLLKASRLLQLWATITSSFRKQSTHANRKVQRV